MGKRYKHNQEGKEAVRRFEEMLKNGENLFFDLNVFEEIIDHYIEAGKFKKASGVCDMAMAQYPYSTELLIQKAHLLIRKEEFTEAWDLLEKAEL
ncbi:MAG TPA: hypothetical protein VNW06_01320, partial [Cytophagaceae bacterium]|nr:hypothetical protein [Cytophagaceae bacterium]